jgi:hypothetical protein
MIPSFVLCSLLVLPELRALVKLDEGYPEEGIEEGKGFPGQE